MIARDRIASMRERELQRFEELRPRGMELLARTARSMPNGVPMSWMATLYEHPPIVVDRGSGATFTDVDGNRYLDFNLADTSMFAGYGSDALSRVAAERVAAGSQFMLPTEDALAVALELERRFGLPSWQFTLSATQANTEAIRVARAVTGRSAVLMFDGKYHGHADELLSALEEGEVVPEGRGLPPGATQHVRIVQFNDLEAVERELARGDVACVISEAAITNVGVIRPADGFHAALRRLTAASGALLAIDETHTLVAGPGGLTARWGLEPDLLVVGKAIANGIPLGAYGMTAEVAGVLEHDMSESFREGVATGGIETVIAGHDLPWRAHRLFNRSGYTHAPELPADALEARARIDLELFNVQRLYMANRGIWEAIDSAGPACGTQASEADVDRYLQTLDDFLRDVAR